jgi:glycosyltransferase involved in cell wall biosynthesis
MQGKRGRIFITGLRGLPDVMGGVESHCEELLPRVARINPDLDITVLGRIAYMGDEKRAFERITVVPLPSTRSMYWEALVSTFLGVIYARLKGADIVHIHAIGPALLSPLARLLGMGVIVTHHGEDFNREKWGPIAKAALRWGERTAVKWAHRVIAVSPTITERLRSLYPRHADKVSFLPNGAPIFDIDKEEAVRTVRQFSLEPGEYFMAAGRLVPEKGFHSLIDAFVRSGLKDKKLVIVGSSDHDTAYSRELLEYGDGQIMFLGKRSRSVLAALYANCACFVLPSTHEALAIVALEAASCGAPILMNDIPANRNFDLPEEGYFEKDAAEQFAEKLRNPPTHDPRDSARILQRYNWDESAAGLERIYATLLESRLPVPNLAPLPESKG